MRIERPIELIENDTRLDARHALLWLDVQNLVEVFAAIQNDAGTD